MMIRDDEKKYRLLFGKPIEAPETSSDADGPAKHGRRRVRHSWAVAPAPFRCRQQVTLAVIISACWVTWQELPSGTQEGFTRTTLPCPGGQVMEYRVFLLSKAGRVCASEQFIGADDDEATEIATALQEVIADVFGGCEVWRQGTMLVASIRPTPSDRAKKIPPSDLSPDARLIALPVRQEKFLKRQSRDEAARLAIALP